MTDTERLAAIRARVAGMDDRCLNRAHAGLVNADVPWLLEKLERYEAALQTIVDFTGTDVPAENLEWVQYLAILALEGETRVATAALEGGD